mmetsp:Transcript_8474/g.13931  ORF Transcript_8474/g.13931 Transcript_8474/m.13931 type:complete len:323 (-) Transcript_8474:255-1223(-)|eukprot:CAMPEP_0197025200 /NCGR_PEP_ID=MMETSP1384-20130603/5599_1 /TAXON_ID=29189 /ORGANISM="Ammonia sp." /LENGTH=322 /DNA_ID=CAMNT_0042453699 /DNA_START=60 /DNA_END=1028 /DNA_ORIENTATION=+
MSLSEEESADCVRQLSVPYVAVIATTNALMILIEVSLTAHLILAYTRNKLETVRSIFALLLLMIAAIIAFQVMMTVVATECTTDDGAFSTINLLGGVAGTLAAIINLLLWYIRLYHVFSQSALALSACTNIGWMLYFAISFIFAAIVIALAFSKLVELSSLLFVGLSVLLIAGLIVLPCLFLYKLRSTVKALKVENDLVLIDADTQITILSLVSILVSIASRMVGAASLYASGRLVVFLAIQVSSIQKFVDFACNVLSFKFYGALYVGMCGPLHSSCNECAGRGKDVLQMANVVKSETRVESTAAASAVSAGKSSSSLNIDE